MKKYVRYSMVVLLGGLLLGLAGCGSSDGSSCSSGETMTTAGCGTGSCTVPGTNQQGALVNNTCAAVSGNSALGNYSCAMQPGTTLQAIPPTLPNGLPDPAYQQFAQFGYEGCCTTSYQGLECWQPMPNTYGTTGTVGSPCPIPGYPQGYVYEGGSTCMP